jgi:zinc protease
MCPTTARRKAKKVTPMNDLLEQYRSLPSSADITRSTLSNGITVLMRTNRNSAAVSLAGYVGAGSLLDPMEKLGLADFTAQALKYGTQNYGFQEIYDLLESCGANLGFSASIHNTNFSGRCLSEDLPLLLDLLRDTLTQPTFPENEVGMLKDQLLASLRIRAQDTRAISANTFDRLLYGSHVYGVPTEGEPETVSTITAEDLRQFHSEHYGPRGMAIAVTGDINIPAVLTLLETTLGSWVNPDQSAEPLLAAPTGPKEKQRKHITIPGKYQTDLVMGTLGPARKSKDFLTALLGNNILGQFGLMGRIGDVVRDQAGLAYYASTSLHATSLCGAWEVVAGVNPANLERAIELIQQELERFRTTPVWAEELADSKANLIGRLPISLESNAGVAYLLLRIERFELGLDYLHDYVRSMQTITAENIRSVAWRYLDLEKLVIASAGPPLVKDQ